MAIRFPFLVVVSQRQCQLKCVTLLGPEGEGKRMSQTSRIVTVIDGIEVLEVTTFDREGDPVGTHYYVQGEKYSRLGEARDAAKRTGQER